MKKESSLYFNKNLITTFIIFLFLFIISSYIYDNDSTATTTTTTNNNIRSDKIINHTKNLIDIGNSKSIYEESRSIAREYIRDYLVNGGIPKDNIVWNHFEWSERNDEGKNITTTTWTGINIIIWINTTSSSSNSNSNQPIRIIASNYDTKNWGLNKTSGAFDSLAGAGLIIEEALELFSFQERESKRTGTPNDTPYMFILFDQEKPGSLGSRSFVDNNNIAKMASKSQIAYFLNVDAVGSHNGRTIIQTFPYQHKHQTFFTPRWLINTMVKSAYSVNPVNGITVGSSLSVGASIMYQAHRYHIHSVKYLGDEGPFTWAGVDSILLTDVDFFYCYNSHFDHKNSNNDSGGVCNHHQGKLSDQPNHLDAYRLKETADIVYRFILNTRSPSSIPNKDSFKIYTKYPALNLLIASFKKFLNTFLSVDQYLLIGPICFGYLQIVFATLFLLSFIYFTSFKNYKELVLQYEKCKYQKKQTLKEESTISEQKDKDIDLSSSSSSSLSSSSSTTSTTALSSTSNKTTINNSFFSSIRGHRILFFHLLLLTVATLIDTVYDFEMVCLGFLSLATFHINKFNILTGFISSAFCINFIYKDLTQIFTIGNGLEQSSSLNILLVVYIIHSILIIIYGFDYSKKTREINKLNNINK